MGTDLEVVGTDPEAAGTNLEAVGTDPEAFGTNPETASMNPEARRGAARGAGVGRGAPHGVAPLAIAAEGVRARVGKTRGPWRGVSKGRPRVSLPLAGRHDASLPALTRGDPGRHVAGAHSQVSRDVTGDVTRC